MAVMEPASDHPRGPRGSTGWRSDTPAPAAPRGVSVLLIIPGDVNYFYNLYAHWMAEGFRALGADVTLCELHQAPRTVHDLCIISNIGEVLHAAGPSGRAAIEALRKASGLLVNFSAECVETRWFAENVALCHQFGIRTVLDIGFRDQSDRLGPGFARSGMAYHFAFDGLLESQARHPGTHEPESGRFIPWAHVGMHTPSRVRLTDQLIREVASDGLIYLPEVSPVKEKGSPHLGPRQMDRVLARTRYYVWCTHHAHFYMESLRYKTAWSTGCVPIKAVGDDEPLPDPLPFRAWVERESAVPERLHGMDFTEARRAFELEYQRAPRLEHGLATFLEALGHAPRARRLDLVESARLCA